MTTQTRKKLDVQVFITNSPKNSGYHWMSTTAHIWDCIDALIYASISTEVKTIGDEWIRLDKIEAASHSAVLRFQAYMVGWCGETFVSDILKLIESGKLK
jgi:hypothetical protein